MELLLILLIALIGLAAFDVASAGFGVDSRADTDDRHAPFTGAH